MSTAPPMRVSRPSYCRKNTPAVPASTTTARNTALKPATKSAAPSTIRLRLRSAPSTMPLTYPR